MTYKPKISLDLDGTISASMEMFLQFYNLENKTDYRVQDITGWNTWEVIGTDYENFWRIWNYMMSAKALPRLMDPNIPFYVAHLQEHYHIDVVTARSREGGILAKQWLREKQFSKIKVIRIEPGEVSDKFELKYDIVIDDFPGYADVARKRPEKEVIIHASPWNRPTSPLPDNCIRLKTWEQIHDYLLIEHQRFVKKFEGKNR